MEKEQPNCFRRSSLIGCGLTNLKQSSLIILQINFNWLRVNQCVRNQLSYFSKSRASKINKLL